MKSLITLGMIACTVAEGGRLSTSNARCTVVASRSASSFRTVELILIRGCANLATVREFMQICLWRRGGYCEDVDPDGGDADDGGGYGDRSCSPGADGGARQLRRLYHEHIGKQRARGGRPARSRTWRSGNQQGLLHGDWRDRDPQASGG